MKTTTETNKATTETMKAVVWDRYGAPQDVLKIRGVPRPRPGDGEVLVRVRAAGANPYDWHYYRGDPFLIRVMPGVARARESQRLGSDFAGEVAAVGLNVTGFRVGDRVYGGVDLGSFAEYVAVPSDRLTPMPPNMTFTEAAAVPMGATTALAALKAG